jgi:hypothetical protein
MLEDKKKYHQLQLMVFDFDLQVAALIVFTSTTNFSWWCFSFELRICPRPQRFGGSRAKESHLRILYAEFNRPPTEVGGIFLSSPRINAMDDLSEVRSL